MKGAQNLGETVGTGRRLGAWAGRQMTLLLDGNCVAWSCCNELVSLAIMNKKGNKCALREKNTNERGV